MRSPFPSKYRSRGRSFSTSGGGRQGAASQSQSFGMGGRGRGSKGSFGIRRGPGSGPGSSRMTPEQASQAIERRRAQRPGGNMGRRYFGNRQGGMSRPRTGLAGGRSRQPSGGNRGNSAGMFNPPNYDPPPRKRPSLPNTPPPSYDPPPRKRPKRRRPSRPVSGLIDPSKGRKPLPRRKRGLSYQENRRRRLYRKRIREQQERARRRRSRRKPGMSGGSNLRDRRSGGFIQSRGGRGANRGRSIPGRRRYYV